GREQVGAGRLEGVYAEQVEARIALAGREQAHLPELADVAEVERRAAVVELEAEVRVLVRHEAVLLLRSERGAPVGGGQANGARVLGEELSGHAQVEQQATAVLELRQQVLPAPLERGDDRARQLALEPRRRGQEEVALLGGEDLRNPPPHEERRDPPACDFDFGELGQGPSVRATFCGCASRATPSCTSRSSRGCGSRRPRSRRCSATSTRSSATWTRSRSSTPRACRPRRTCSRSRRRCAPTRSPGCCR